jgi:hypothetical protein
VVKHLVVGKEDERLFLRALRMYEMLLLENIHAYKNGNADIGSYVQEQQEELDRLKNIINGIEQSKRQTSI